MRQFRVGSISMGVAFVLLGISILSIQVLGLESNRFLLAWWPVIFILLGIEMLVYLFKRKEEHPIIKFDFLSVLFVGFIGTIGIGVIILFQLGLVDEIKDEFNRSYQTAELPMYTDDLTGINKVIIDTNDYGVALYSNTENKVDIFGTVEGSWNAKAEVIFQPTDYVVTQKSGDTLFITLKKTYPFKQSRVDIYDQQVTIILPNDIKVEVNGNDNNQFKLSLDSLLNEWSITNTDTVSIAELNDFKLDYSNINELVVKGETVDTKKTTTLGSGEFSLSIKNVRLLTVE